MLRFLRTEICFIAREFLLKIDTSLAIATSGLRTNLLFEKPPSENPPFDFPEISIRKGESAKTWWAFRPRKKKLAPPPPSIFIYNKPAPRPPPQTPPPSPAPRNTKKKNRNVHQEDLRFSAKICVLVSLCHFTLKTVTSLDSSCAFFLSDNIIWDNEAPGKEGKNTQKNKEFLERQKSKEINKKNKEKKIWVGLSFQHAPQVLAHDGSRCDFKSGSCLHAQPA